MGQVLANLELTSDSGVIRDSSKSLRSLGLKVEKTLFLSETTQKHEIKFFMFLLIIGS